MQSFTNTNVGMARPPALHSAQLNRSCSAPVGTSALRRPAPSDAVSSSPQHLPRSAPLRASSDASGGASASQASAPAGAAAALPALTYTSFEGNSWRAEFGASGLRVLVDPWLVDDLTFGGLGFIYRGVKRAARPEAAAVDALAAATDLVLLTMSIDDHAHRPTLRRLPKSLHVVGSPSAAAVARELGFLNVTAVDHGEEVEVCGGRLAVRATQGALVGPPWSKRENGFVLSERAPGGIRVYYEPHADYVAASVAAVGAVDVVVSPPSTQSLLGYRLVKGATDNVPLLRMLRPAVVVPLMNAEFDASGALNALLTETGGPAELEAQLAAEPGLEGVRVCLPVAGVPMPVHL